jgi:hypothetical protein
MSLHPIHIASAALESAVTAAIELFEAEHPGVRVAELYITREGGRLAGAPKTHADLRDLGDLSLPDPATQAVS